MVERALRFSDAVIVQISGSALPGEPVSSAASLGRKFEDVTQDIGRILKPLVSQVATALQDNVESCTLEVAFSFTAEGSLFLCKAGAEASITIKAQLKGAAVGAPGT